MRYYLLALLLIFSVKTYSQYEDSFYAASWNVENLFDTIDDSLKADEDFTPEGSKEWNEKRFLDKIKNLAHVIGLMNDGNGPDIIGLVEVEHKYILELLVQKYFKRNYNVVGFESPDKRGIDNYIIYDASKFDIIDSHRIPVNFFSHDYITRDILHASFEFNNERFDLFVNHWPSRRGGVEASQPRRISAASVLRQTLDSLRQAEVSNNFILLGDFNDEPDNYSLNEILNARKFEDREELINLSWQKFNDGLGTHLYQKEFNFLDHIIISDGLIDRKGIDYLASSFDIFSDYSFIYNEGKQKGAIIPTFHAGKYIGGYADHLPVSAKFYMKEE